MNNPVLSLSLDLVVVTERLRPVNADYVELIAASMGERGQDTPVKVGPPDAAGRHRLIAGGHRVAAAQLLGWTQIDAIVTEATGLEAELAEVDENLMRRELSALDRAVFLAKRKAIYEQLHPGAAHGRAPKGKDRKLATFSAIPSFRAETAARLGLDETSINRIVRRAELVRDNPGLHMALSRSPVADSGAELDRLLEQPADTRAKLVEALTRAEKPARSVAAAISEITGPPPNTKGAEITAQFNRLMEAWRKASHAKARRMFLDELVEQAVVVLPSRADAA